MLLLTPPSCNIWLPFRYLGKKSDSQYAKYTEETQRKSPYTFSRLKFKTHLKHRMEAVEEERTIWAVNAQIHGFILFLLRLSSLYCSPTINMISYSRSLPIIVKVKAQRVNYIWPKRCKHKVIQQSISRTNKKKRIFLNAKFGLLTSTFTFWWHIYCVT